MEDNRPSYYAIIPADVRYDEDIPANAKLLYGEISALINKDGFCYASNQYFAERYKWSLPTITRLITALEEHGYITRQLIKDSSGKVVQRKLFLSVSVPEEQPPIKNNSTPYQNCLEGPIKNDEYTNLSNTDIEKENRKEKAGSKKRAALTDEQLHNHWKDWIVSVSQPDWSRDSMNSLHRSIMAFYEPRETKKQEPARTATACSRLGNLLVQYSSGSPASMVQLLDRATASGWKSVYPPKEFNSGKSAEPAVRRANEVVL